MNSMKSGRSGAHRPGKLGLSCKANKCSDAGTGDFGVLPAREISPMKMGTLWMSQQATALPSSQGCLRPLRGQLDWWCLLNPPRVNADTSTSKLICLVQFGLYEHPLPIPLQRLIQSASSRSLPKQMWTINVRIIELSECTLKIKIELR